jgi:VanZ family protein
MNKIILWLVTLFWTWLTLYLTTIPNFSPAPDTLFSWLISNGGHFFFFGVLAGLLHFLLIQYSLFSWHYSLVPVSLYGLLIEYIQLGVPGRSYDLKDWVLDTLGAITFLFFLKKLQSKL